jgi:hypothetical protein
MMIFLNAVQEEIVTPIVDSGQTLNKTNRDQLKKAILIYDQKNTGVYFADSGAANTYAVTMSPAPTAYTAGLEVKTKILNSNTGAATLNVNSLGAKNIKLLNGNNPTKNQLKAGMIAKFIYDGTNFQLLNPAPIDYSFLATCSIGQALPSLVETKINIDTVVFDNGGFFDIATYKFTPPAGTYLVVGAAGIAAASANVQIRTLVRKSGVNYGLGKTGSANLSNWAISANAPIPMSFNGTDYLELYVKNEDSVSRNLDNGVAVTYLAAYGPL